MHGGWRWFVEIERIHTSDRGRLQHVLVCLLVKIEKASKGLPICPFCQPFSNDATRTGQRRGELEISIASLTTGEIEREQESNDCRIPLN